MGVIRMKKKLLCLTLCTLLLGAVLIDFRSEDPPGWGMSNQIINQSNNPSRLC